MDAYDLLIIGGGINGAAIARDAAIRGARVLLVEKDDLAAHTSSASSKLIHGGLRYLEYGEFRLVRESLAEREILLRTAPHIVRPLRFVLPQAKRIHPHWMVRAGLYLYDLFSIRGSLPRSRRLGGQDAALLAPLKERRRALSYWDAWVDDSRLTILNAVDAADQGAEIATRTALVRARREGGVWRAELSDGRSVEAKAMVNAAGPWVGDILARAGVVGRSASRLVKGSHLAVAALWEGDQGYILQQPDGRVVFALPWLGRFTLIGTTDVPVENAEPPAITPEETRYLCDAANRYFEQQLKPADVLSSYSGIRALYDDGAQDAKSITRDWHLDLDENGPPILSVYGGKITTARALARRAVDRLGIEGRRSTGSKALPGGDLYPAFVEWLDQLSAWMPAELVTRLSQAYGTRLVDLVGNARSLKQLGRHFGGGLYEAELTWMREREFARTGEDALFRRSKLGLLLSKQERQAVERWFA
ncbi:MAG TPA: glycerol-3-phosphate dehydrogenase [Allosphingosinicella sp.]|jgi:glycerol-3-phosphate dehydrogenase